MNLRKTVATAALAALPVLFACDPRGIFTGTFNTTSTLTITFAGSAPSTTTTQGPLSVVSSETDPTRILIQAQCPLSAWVNSEAFVVDPVTCPAISSAECTSIVLTVEDGSGYCERGTNLNYSTLGSVAATCTGGARTGTFTTSNIGEK